jgi:hypothetical protein
VFDIANALGLCFPGGSVQISEPGEPCVFNAILGALELSLGDDCTDVIDATDSAVVFFAKEKVATLTGRGVDTFVLDEISEEAGALPWTVQRIGKTVYLDLRGMRDLTATAAFGNFKTGALSELFDRYLEAKRRAGAQPVASLRVKSKSQYRVYYSDGTGFTVYMGGKNPEMLPFETDAHAGLRDLHGRARGRKRGPLRVRQRRLRLPARQRHVVRWCPVAASSCCRSTTSATSA